MLGMFHYLTDQNISSMLMFAAHPDDEIVGAGITLACLPNLTVVHVTDGVPNDPRYASWAGFDSSQAYKKARTEEALRALNAQGLSPDAIIKLAVVDQQLSRLLVPLTHSIRDIIRSYRPDMVISHPYEGGHPDHDAVCFATHHALQLLEMNDEPVPRLVEMTSYFCRNGKRVVSEFAQGDAGAVSLLLDEAERERKAELYSYFISQKDLLSTFPIEVEKFRLAPRYDFTKIPDIAEILYDRYELGTTSSQWQELSSAAIKILTSVDSRQQRWRTERPPVG